MLIPQKRLFDFSDVFLYCITMPPRPGQTYLPMVQAACQGGADVIQLRDKNLSARALVELCQELQNICHATGTLFVLNDRVDVALAADLDGVHVGQDDLPVKMARQILGHKKIIGCSCHSLAQAKQAQSDGADYVSCGPLFSTPTKPDYQPVGLGLIKEYLPDIKIPFVPIGGIDDSNLEQVLAAGAPRAAVVRAVCGADDIQSAAKRFKDKIKTVNVSSS